MLYSTETKSSTGSVFTLRHILPQNADNIWQVRMFFSYKYHGSHKYLNIRHPQSTINSIYTVIKLRSKYQNIWFRDAKLPFSKQLKIEYENLID